jgi:hypothetical protein
VIGTKWVFRNKQDQDGIVVRNKTRLVAQGYTQIEGLDFGETYALVVDWKQSGSYWHMHVLMISSSIKWMSKVHS